MEHTPKLFFLYAPADKAHRDAIVAQLSKVIKENEIKTWDISDEKAGGEWRKNIDHHLNEADFVVLLVSAEFLSDNYLQDLSCYDIMTQAHTIGKALLPVIVSHCAWDEEPIIAEAHPIPIIDNKTVPISSKHWETKAEVYDHIRRAIMDRVRSRNRNTNADADANTITGSNANSKGFILYDIPTKMQIQNEHPCLIRVAFDKNMLLEYLPQNIPYVIKNVSLSGTMEACFISNEYFKVKPLNSIRQRVLRDDITEWHFNVTPLEIGTFPIEFKITIVLDGGLKEVVLRERIMVITERVPQSMIELKKIASLEFSLFDDSYSSQGLPYFPSAILTSPPESKPTSKTDFAAIEKAYKNADWVEVIDLLDDHFGDDPTPQYSILKRSIEAALNQSLQPTLANQQALKMLINKLKR